MAKRSKPKKTHRPAKPPKERIVPTDPLSRHHHLGQQVHDTHRALTPLLTMTTYTARGVERTQSAFIRALARSSDLTAGLSNNTSEPVSGGGHGDPTGNHTLNATDVHLAKVARELEDLAERKLHVDGRLHQLLGEVLHIAKGEQGRPKPIVRVCANPACPDEFYADPFDDGHDDRCGPCRVYRREHGGVDASEQVIDDRHRKRAARNLV